MKKILVLCFVLNFLAQITFGETRVIRTYENVPTYNYNSNIYNSDLSIAEEYLFGNNFAKDNLESRLTRLEKRIFSNCYSSMNPAQRVNNILANYRQDYNGNYLPNYNRTTPAQRILNRFIGQPTGFTPPIMNTPFNEYGRPYSLNQGTFNNRGGYRYNNELPAAAGFGIRILD